MQERRFKSWLIAKNANKRVLQCKRVTGSGVGMLAFGSPMFDQAITPPLITISGFVPKNDGFHTTRSANFPTCKISKKIKLESMTMRFEVLNFSEDNAFSTMMTKERITTFQDSNSFITMQISTKLVELDVLQVF